MYTYSRRFHTHLPLLHFLADRKTFFTPTPLLLASILYISSLHHNSAEYASLAPGYFAATCSAIADLVMPSPAFDMGDANELEFKVDEIAFNNILGLIMASLSSEAFIDATGSWISIGYRLLLDHCPHKERGPLDWKGLFSGLQVGFIPSLSNFYVLRKKRLSMSNTLQFICAIHYCQSSHPSNSFKTSIAHKTLHIVAWLR